MLYRNKKSGIRSLAALVLVSALLIGNLPSSASAVTQEEIDELRARRNEITAQKDAKQAEVDNLAEQKAGVVEQKRALDERNAYTLEQMRLNQEEIDYYDEIIAEKAEEVAAARALEEEQLERYRVRVRAMEERGSYNILALILRSNNLGELLTTIDDVGEIMESDRELEDAYIAARQHHEAVKAEYEGVKAELQAKQQELMNEQARLEDELKQAEELILQLTADIDTYSEEINQLQADEDAADIRISEMVAELEAQRIEEERRRQEAAQEAARASGSGTFAWPVGAYYITSIVGNRYHPISGNYSYHSGMDIGAGYGSTVWASDSGTVTCADWNGGYGICVMIDHGNGYYTTYAHLSSCAVYVGQWVNKGDTIGYVGSTGNSTGPHLHFEIRDGSGAIEFNDWFGGLTFSPDSGW